RLLNGGTARISGGLQQVTITPSSDGQYQPDFLAGLLWNPGQQLLFSFDGNLNVPIILPSAGVVAGPQTSSVQPSPLPTTLSRGSSLTVTWTPSTGADFVIFGNEGIAGITPTGQVIAKFSFGCSFPLDAGGATIPASVVSILPVGSAQLGYQIENHTEHVVGGQTFVFEAVTNGVGTNVTITD